MAGRAKVQHEEATGKETTHGVCVRTAAAAACACLLLHRPFPAWWRVRARARADCRAEEEAKAGHDGGRAQRRPGGVESLRRGRRSEGASAAPHATPGTRKAARGKD